jgi:L-ascorbate metabolism protein UlaG (beta-lactamase superfamily)
MGNAGWLIQSDGLLIGIDLDLEADEKVEAPPITAAGLAPLIDVVFATHHHGDHCNVATIRTLARAGGARFVLPRPCRKRVAELGIAEDRIVVPAPGQPFDVEGVRVEPTHAIHGNQDFTVLTREPDFVESIAHNCGYVLHLGGRRLFHPGDSVLTEEHLELKDIDVLFVSPTVHNMYVDRSMILINRLQPAYVFPQHFGTYRQTEENAFWTRGYPDELHQRLSRDLQKRYHKLRPGELFVVPPVTETGSGDRGSSR